MNLYEFRAKWGTKGASAILHTAAAQLEVTNSTYNVGVAKLLVELASDLTDVLTEE